MGHRGMRFDDLELTEVLLDSTEDELLVLKRNEQRLLSIYRLLTVLTSLVDVSVLGFLHLSNVHDNGGFDIRSTDFVVLYLVAFRCTFQTIGVVSGLRSTDSSFSHSLMVFVYWLSVTCLILSIANLIALDWDKSNQSNSSTSIIVSTVLNALELFFIDRCMKWKKEVGNWKEKDMEQSGEKKLSKLGKPSMSLKGLALLLKPYFWPKGILNKVRCLLTWVFLLVSKAANMISPIYIGRAVQKLSSLATVYFYRNFLLDYHSDESLLETDWQLPVLGKTDDEILHEVYKDIIVYASLVLASKIMKEAQSVIYLRVKQTAYTEIAVTVFEHLHSLSLEWHLKKKMGNVLRSMDRGVQAADSVVTYLFLYLGPSIIESVIVFIIFYTHFDIPLLSATAFISFSAYIIVTVKITLWRKQFRRKTNKHDNEFHDKATDSVINYETVKYFTAEKFEIGRYSESIKKYQKYSISTQASLSVLNATQALVAQLCVSVSLCIAAHEVAMNKDFEVGNFVAVNAYILNLFAPLSFLGTVYNIVIQAFVDMTNLTELLSHTPDVTDEPNAPVLQPIPSGTSGASIEFKNVFFHYPSQPRSSGLKNVSFEVKAGTSTAVVGHTGAGKTTISRLLFRFYDPISGSIAISKQDIAKVQQISLRQSIGVVPQDTVLFNDTIRYNIAYGEIGKTGLSPSEDEIIQACKDAKIYDFILSLPEGFDTMVGERGLRLSGGEKQRVAIARCLLKNPPIVILDEATSALDTLTEKSVQASLNSLTMKRTTVVIAHRLSTVKDCDQIVVLDKGNIIEKGNHDELIRLGGEYQKMWTVQSNQTLEG